MHKHFIKLFIKDYNEQNIDEKVRFQLANLSSYLGIVLNLTLFIIKFTLGLLILSISLRADAINNLFDTISSIIALVSFKIAIKPADSQHPFGHGRIEIISELFMGILIVFFALQLSLSSINKILAHQTIIYNQITIYFLIITLILKLYQSSFLTYVGNKINSTLLITTAKDSFNDSILNIIIIISIFIEINFQIRLDGYFGILLAIFILYNGLVAIYQTSSKLLGERVSDKLLVEIKQLLKTYDNILGYHDLIVHKYGFSQYFATVHIEVNSEYSLILVHDIIDKIEYDFKKQLNINLVVHPDPIILNDPTINSYQDSILKIINNYNKEYTLHDFRLIKYNQYNLILFDLVVIYDNKSNYQIKNELKALINKSYPADKVKITIDRNYLL